MSIRVNMTQTMSTLAVNMLKVPWNHAQPKQKYKKLMEMY